MGNYTAVVTREAGRNSWLLRILTEDKNQQSQSFASQPEANGGSSRGQRMPEET